MNTKSLLAFFSIAALTGCVEQEEPPDRTAEEQLLSGPFHVAKARAKELFESDVTAARQDEYFDREVDGLQAILAELKAKRASSPEKWTFVATARVSRVIPRIPDFRVDHSEVSFDAVTEDGEHFPLPFRGIGDGWGAGLYRGTGRGLKVGPSLCLTYDEFRAAIHASYVGGMYGESFVCHTVTARIFATAGVDPSYFDDLVHGFRLARWVYGPKHAEGASKNPSASVAASRCTSL